MGQEGVVVPGNWRGVRNKLEGAPDRVRRYFQPAEELIERYSWEVSLSYLYAKVEEAHLMSIYCGAVKLHRTDAELAWNAVYRFENTRPQFQEVFANVYGTKIPQLLGARLEKAQKVRDLALHGKAKEVPGSDYRMAVAAIIEYAKGFNELCLEKGGPQPFGPLQGFTGRQKTLDKAASRLILSKRTF